MEDKLENSDIVLNNEDPWPGLAAFTEKNANYFFGREREVDDILRAIRQDTLTIIFGKSGLGKSSILQAGVSPKLRESNFIPIYIRLNHHEETLPLEDQVEVFIEDSIREYNIDAPQPIRKETLWEYFHKAKNDWWSEENDLLKPVLIFDQFEEILTAGQENSIRAERCVRFLNELEDLIENRPPTELAEKFKAEKGVAKKYDMDRVDYRVVIALREDYLADLESLRERLRPIMLNRYRLLPLEEKQALNVILQPGGDLVDEDVAKSIINFVSPQKISLLGPSGKAVDSRKIEPSLLSVILRELNKHRISANESKISIELVSQKRPEDILFEFYETGIKDISKKARYFIEQYLLTASGARNRIAEEDAISRYGIDKKTIETLLERRIIQRDKTSNTNWLELSHDTLTPVIQKSAERYRRTKQIKKIAFRSTAIIIFLAICSLGLFHYQSREQSLQTAGASRLAIDLANSLEKDESMSMAAKQKIIERLNKNFDDLKNLSGNSMYLAKSSAEFLIRSSEIQLDQGHYDKAQESIDTAYNIFTEDKFSKNLKKEHPTLYTKIKLAKAQSNYYAGKYTSALDKINQAKQILNTNIDSKKQLSIDVFILSKEIELIESMILHSKKNTLESIELLEKIRNDIRFYIEANNYLANEKNIDDSRKLLETLLWSTFNLYRFNSYSILDNQEIHHWMNEDINITKKILTDKERKMISFFEALSELTNALKNQEDNNKTGARESYDNTIRKLNELSNKNIDDLKIRYFLAFSLDKRAEFARENDPKQHEVDIKSAQAISFSFRKDTSNNHYYCLTKLASGYERMLFINSKNLPTEKEQKKLNSSINFCKSTFHEPYILSHYKLNMALNKLSYLSKNNKIKDKLIIFNKTKNQYLQTLSKLESMGAGREFISTYSHYLLLRELSIYSSLDNIDKKKYQDLFDEIEKYDTIISKWNKNHAKMLVGDRSYLLGERAKLKFKTDKKEAIKLFEKTLSLGIQQANQKTSDKIVIGNTVWTITQLINLYTNDKNWSEAIATGNQLFELINPYQENDRFPDKNYLAKYWKGAHKALKYLRVKLTDQKESTKDTSIVIQHLEELENLILNSEKTFSFLKEKSLNNKNSALYKYSQFDYKSIDDKEMFKNADNNFYSDQPLGWTSAATFQSPNSYTLEAQQYEYNKKLARDQESIIRIRHTPLPFYQEGRLLSVQYLTNKKQFVTRHYLESNKTKQIYHLDGNSSPIHTANNDFPIQLESREQAVSYLRFFTTFLHGDENAGSSFLIIESLEEIPWSNNANEEEKSSVKNLIRPIHIWQEKDYTEKWFATVTISYKESLSYAKLEITKDGKMKMIKDLPIAQKLNVNIINIVENSGRSDKYIKKTVIEPSKEINIETIDEEIEFLKKLYANTKPIDKIKKISIIEEIIYLSKSIASNEEESRKLFFNFDNLLKEWAIKKDEAQPIYTAAQSYFYDTSKYIENEINRIEKLEKINSLEAKYLNLSYYNLLSKNYSDALKSANKGLKINGSYLPLQTNLAHALMLLGSKEEALKIYINNKGKKHNDDVWEDIILDDFKTLKRYGISHPLMDKIILEFEQ